MELKQVIVVRSDLGMGKGKIAAQASHASLEAYEKAKKKNPQWVEQWKASGQTKVVVKAGGEAELLALFERVKNILPAALIRDAGRTQIEEGSLTCLGIGPAPEAEINKFTKDLKLL